MAHHLGLSTGLSPTSLAGRGVAIAGWSLVLLSACQPAKPPMLEHASTSPAADIVDVRATGESGAYRFEVGVRSPDIGCDQYADWWEVISQDGRLLHRRVLSHSHVDEQPFTRSGEPVPVEATTVVWVRAHMHPSGYGGGAFTGSVRDGFEAADLPSSFATDLAERPPHPPECRF